MLVSDACAAIGRKQAWADIEHLSPLEARKALASMQDINASEVPFSQTMLEEKWTDESFLLELFRSPNWREKFIKDHCEGDNKNATRLRLVFVNKRRTFARCVAYCDRCVAMTQGPFSQRHPDDVWRTDDDIVSGSYEPICEKAWIKSLANITGNRLLTVQLALQAYHGEHGACPDTLNALVSAGYLSKLPDDPFALSGSFRYVHTGKGYLLYSLGPDGVDDGGKPIMDSKYPSRPATSLEVDSKGDIVAGVNRL
jgi:hypothetical protein